MSTKARTVATAAGRRSAAGHRSGSRASAGSKGDAAGRARPEVTRHQALAHRLAVQSLDRPVRAADVRELDVWQLGLQDSPAGSAALSLAARVRGGWAKVPDLGDGRRFTTVWGTRGAPLVLRNADVAPFAQALWPVDQADAVSRLAGNGQQLRKGGFDAVEAIRVTASAMHDVVAEAGGPLTKGEISTEVSTRLPEGYITWCRGCQAHHLGDSLMRLAGFPAGLRLVPGASPATLAPIARWKGLPEEPSGREDLVRAYLHLYGPATPGDVGGFLQTSTKAVKAMWPDGLVEVSVDGAKAWLPEDDLDHLLAQPVEPGDEALDPGAVRLLPRSDPWLLARDRERIVPGAAHRKVLWPVIGWPGAVLAGTEVVGAWRARSTKSGAGVAIAVECFEPLPPPIREAVEAEASDIARQRDASTHTIDFTG